MCHPDASNDCGTRVRSARHHRPPCPQNFGDHQSILRKSFTVRSGLESVSAEGSRIEPTSNSP